MALWGYSVYTIILYVIVAVLGVIVIGLAVLAWLMLKGHENSKCALFDCIALDTGSVLTSRSRTPPTLFPLPLPNVSPC